ncbi:NADPH-dependent FMN reductase [Salibacterium salarium]|nr:NADPH-dependent FMN reductase [Salibacterium salarium]
MSNQKMKVLGISGSLRKDSYNRIILREMAQEHPEEMDVSIYHLKHIPLFNADVEENGDPEAVEDFKEAIREADGLLIVTPEYSHGMPGVLKNALDWASSMTNENVINGKPAFVLGSSPSMLGTAFSQAQVKQALAAAGALVLQQPELYIGQVTKKVDETGDLTDEGTKKALRQSLDDFYEWIETMKKR